MFSLMKQAGVRPVHVSSDLQPWLPTRLVRCPHCRRETEVADKAISIRCPHCTGPIRLDNALLKGFSAENIATLGDVRVAKRGFIQGRIECGGLVVEGRLQAEVKVHGQAQIYAHASLGGKVRAHSIVIEPGARVDAWLDLGPEPAPRRSKAKGPATP